MWKRSIDLFSLYVLLSHFRLRYAHALKGICLLSFLQSPSQSPRYRCPRYPFRWTRVTRTVGTTLSFLELNYACLLTGIGRYLIPSRATILVNSPTSTVTLQSRQASKGGFFFPRSHLVKRCVHTVEVNNHLTLASLHIIIRASSVAFPLVPSLPWENSRHLVTPPLVFPRNDVWETSTEIPYWWRVTTQI